MIKRYLTLASILGICAQTQAIDFQFDTAGGFTDGNISGQQGWSQIFVSPNDAGEPATNYWGNISDAAGGLQINNTSTTPKTGGAGRRFFSDADLGTTFNDATSVLSFSSTFSFSGTAINTIGTFSPSASWVFGSDFGATPIFTVSVRTDGIIESNSDGGTVRSDPIFQVGNTYTFDVIIDFANDEYTITSTGTSGSFNRTDSFFNTGTQDTFVRLNSGWHEGYSASGADSTSTNTFTLNGLTYTVPEPSTYALFGGVLALAAALTRRRR